MLFYPEPVQYVRSVVRMGVKNVACTMKTEEQIEEIEV